MQLVNRIKPRVFIDADVLFAGAASPSTHSASLIVLRLAELTLITAIASQQVVVEVERNLAEKMPRVIPAFHLLVSRCLEVTPDPTPGEVAEKAGMAELHDLPILVAALRESCQYLVTFNLRHFQPGHPEIRVLHPGEFVLRVRDLLSHLVG